MLREYHRPATVAEALSLLARPAVKSVPLMPGPRIPAPPADWAEAVIDLSQLQLAYIRVEADDCLHVGALTPVQAVLEAPLLQTLAAGLLPRAAQWTATPALRQVATLGGAALAAAGSPEIQLALLVLAAHGVVATPQGLVTRPLPDLALTPEEFLLEINFARPEELSGALERVSRSPRAAAIVAVAVGLIWADGVCQTARVAVAGAGPRPQRVAAVESLLAGRRLTDEQVQAAAQAMEAAVQPLSDYRASGEYRRALAGVLTRRALQRAGGLA